MKEKDFIYIYIYIYIYIGVSETINQIYEYSKLSQGYEAYHSWWEDFVQREMYNWLNFENTYLYAPNQICSVNRSTLTFQKIWYEIDFTVKGPQTDFIMVKKKGSCYRMSFAFPAFTDWNQRKATTSVTILSLLGYWKKMNMMVRVIQIKYG